MPKGLIDVGKVDDAKKLSMKWIRSTPDVKQNDFFTLGKMLNNTFNISKESIYKESIEKKRIT